jgi:hypothetical protein
MFWSFTMRKHTLLAAIAVAALAPSLAAAQNACEQHKHDQRVAGTVLGAIGGAILGSQVSGHGARTEGSAIGAVGGAVVGNQLARSHTDCSGYGYYDGSGVWHANVSGYYDNNHHWVNARADGFYDSDGAWHARGPGRLDEDGYWVAEAPAADSYGANVAYTSGDPWAGAPYGLRERENWLEQRIRHGMETGALSHDDGDRALDRLNHIRSKEAAYRRPDGSISPNDRASIEARLDSLRHDVHLMRNVG